jgi:hypothetical protein
MMKNRGSAWLLMAAALAIAAILATDAGAIPTRPSDTPAPAAAPSIPHGKLVYQSDFAKGTGPEWWPRWTERTPKGDRPFLGQFGIEPATFTLRGLPAHKFVRLHLSLFMLEPSDGSSDIWGPDLWELRVLGGPRLLYTTFDNCCYFTDNNEQAFPDDFPWAINKGWTGAAETRTLGYPHDWGGPSRTWDCSSVYDLTLVFPHEDADLRLLARALWSECFKKGGESWGLESLEVEVLDGPQALTDEQLGALWQDLHGDDAAKAFTALWTMVSGGPKTVDFIAGRLGMPVGKPPEPVEEIGRLLWQLDDPSYQVREQATRRLGEIGRPYLPELRKVEKTTESPEVRLRLRDVIKKLEAEQKAADAQNAAGRSRLTHDLGPARAVRVLETIGGEEALKVLEKAAGQAQLPAAPLAAAARLRLAERMLDEMLARAAAADIAGDTTTADELCKQAADFAKAHLPEDQRRVAAAVEDVRLRRKARTAVAVSDAASKREAVRGILTVGDDPAGAAQFAAQLLDDAKLVQALRLAGQTPEDLKPDEVQALRTFYIEEAKSAMEWAKSTDSHVAAGLVARAMAVTRPSDKPTEDRFDPAEGIPRDLLAAWAADQAGRGRWTDLVPLMDLPPNPKTPNFVPNSQWQREWHGPTAGGAPPPLVLPVRPQGSYQVRLLLVPKNVTTLTVWVPVGDSHVCVDVFRAGVDAAIRIKPDDVAVSAVWPAPEQISAGENLADVTVIQEAGGAVRIHLDVDGRTLVEWRGKTSDIQKQDGEPPAGQPAVDFDGAQILLRTVAVRMLDGKLTVTPADKPQPAPAPQPAPMPAPAPAVEIHLEIDNGGF